MNGKYWHVKRGGYANPLGNLPSGVTIGSGLRYVLSRIVAPPLVLGKDLPSNHVLTREEFFAGLKKYESVPSITWLGHCSFLIRIGGKTLLTDPFLTSTAGPRILRALKRLPLPVSLSELPDVDLLLVSHPHDDHMHIPTLRTLIKLGKIKKAVAPLKAGRRLRKLGIGDVEELDWFESLNTGEVTVRALPAAHYSTVFPRHDMELWSSFSIESKGVKVFFSGDSGYGEFFKRDIRKYGPFNTALFGVVNLVRSSLLQAARVHTSPEEAVMASKDIDAKELIGMHWGTAHMTEEDTESTGRLSERMHAEAKKIAYEGNIRMLRIGETTRIKSLEN